MAVTPRVARGFLEGSRLLRSRYEEGQIPFWYIVIVTRIFSYIPRQRFLFFSLVTRPQFVEGLLVKPSNLLEVLKDAGSERSDSTVHTKAYDGSGTVRKSWPPRKGPSVLYRRSATTTSLL